MNMGRTIILIMIFAIWVPFAIELFWPIQFVAWLDSHKTFLTSLNILSIFGLILTLYLTVHHFNISQANEEKQSIAEHNTKIFTLLKEFEINQIICENEILNTYEKYKDKDALPVPESRFHLEILKSFISSGIIANEESNYVLWNIYRIMSVSNSLLSQAIQIRYYEHIADPRDMMSINGRKGKINSLVKEAVRYAQNVKDIIPQAIEELEKSKKA